MINYITIPIILVLIILVANSLIHKFSKKKSSPLVYRFRIIIERISSKFSKLGKPINKKKSKSHFYSRHKKSILYSLNGFSLQKGNKKIDCDFDSFKVIDNFYSKDKRFVFFEHKKIDYLKIHAKTFRVINHNYSKDKNRVFYLAYHFGNKPLNIVWKADPKSFRILNECWSQDHNYMFFKNRALPLDKASFKIINTNFCEDKEGVYPYYAWNDENDRSKYQFKRLRTYGKVHKYDDYYIYDDKFLYYLCIWRNGLFVDNLNIIPLNNVEDIKKLDDDYIIVNNKLYYEGCVVKNVDINSLKKIESIYYKDKYHLICCGNIYPIEDFNKLKYDEKRFIYYDHKYVYYNDKAVKIKQKELIN